jgi:hypothetical protein
MGPSRFPAPSNHRGPRVTLTLPEEPIRVNVSTGTAFPVTVRVTGFASRRSPEPSNGECRATGTSDSSDQGHWSSNCLLMKGCPCYGRRNRDSPGRFPVSARLSGFMTSRKGSYATLRIQKVFRDTGNRLSSSYRNTSNGVPLGTRLAAQRPGTVCMPACAPVWSRRSCAQLRVASSS